jgi:hypothetical protein
VKLNLNRFPDDAVHTSVFGGKDESVVQLDSVPQIDTLLRHG